MTVGTVLFIIFLFFLVCFAISMLVELFFKFFPQGKECYLPVKSLSTGIEYHASRYKFNRKGDMELLIYNHVSHNYEWYPIWHFKQAFILAMQLDTDYAKENIYKLLTMNAMNLTKDNKK